VLSIPEHLAAGVQHHQAGRLDEAEALYRCILHEAPQHAQALHLLGVRMHQAGRFHEAIDLIQCALAARGPDAIFHSNLAAAYLGMGLFAEAESHCRTALNLRPGFADALSNMGLALRGQGHLDQAGAAYREALRLDPQHVDARRHLDALDAGRHQQVGFVLLADGQVEQAVRHFEEAMRLQPGFAEAHRNLGLARQRLNQLDDALHCFREALRLDHANSKARINLASTLEAQGKIAEAVAAFREALRLEPDNSQALLSLSELAAAGYDRFADEEIRRIEALAARSDLPIDDQCRLGYALGRIFDQAGSCAQAFAHIHRANELRREIDRRCGVVFDPAAQRALIDRMITTFTPGYFERVRSFGVDSELPVFVVGMPRSGTSLAEQILASHPQVHGAGELRELDTLIMMLPGRVGTDEGYPECLASMDAATTRSVALRHVQRLRHLGGAAGRVADKNPLNFLHLGLIATLFPRARIIHCRRHPADTCLSCYFQNFAGPYAFVRDLRDLGEYYREYERLMEHWTRVLPLPVFDLSYEELAANQESLSKGLTAFCGLEWDERCLRFHETQRVVWTASTLQVRRPLYRSSVGRWKRYEAYLQPLLVALRAPSTCSEKVLKETARSSR